MTRTGTTDRLPEELLRRAGLGFSLSFSLGFGLGGGEKKAARPA